MAEHSGEAEMFDRECRIMGMFIDNAKTYVQLSTGALLLSVTFMREILAIPKETRLPFDCRLILTWAGFLAAVMCGTYYQYLAVKFLEEKSGVPRSHRAW